LRCAAAAARRFLAARHAPPRPPCSPPRPPPRPQTLGSVVSPAVLQSALLPQLSRYAHDPVPNIRFGVAKAFEALAPRLDAAARQTIAKPVLQSLALDREADVQHFALRALAALG
jgi:serine/threonine-protein phosphatase 2A regulatory subunit A